MFESLGDRGPNGDRESTMVLVEVVTAEGSIQLFGKCWT